MVSPVVPEDPVEPAPKEPVSAGVEKSEEDFMTPVIAPEAPVEVEEPKEPMSPGVEVSESSEDDMMTPVIKTEELAEP
jgi:hypothetical protein